MHEHATERQLRFSSLRALTIEESQDIGDTLDGWAHFGSVAMTGQLDPSLMNSRVSDRTGVACALYLAGYADDHPVAASTAWSCQSPRR